jgi:hypothetical protein
VAMSEATTLVAISGQHEPLRLVDFGMGTGGRGVIAGEQPFPRTMGGTDRADPIALAEHRLVECLRAVLAGVVRLVPG